MVCNPISNDNIWWDGAMMESNYLGYGLFDVKSESSDDTYRVDVLSEYCECRGFFYGKKRTAEGKKTCKHLEKLRKVKMDGER